MKRDTLFIVHVVLAFLVSSVTAMMMIGQQPAFVQGGPSACPDPGQCTCNPATGVMTDLWKEVPVLPIRYSNMALLESLIK
jgi:hypothetical protein